MSALHLAARNGHSVVVLSLINAGIPVNTVVREREGGRERGRGERGRVIISLTHLV